MLLFLTLSKRGYLHNIDIPYYGCTSVFESGIATSEQRLESSRNMGPNKRHKYQKDTKNRRKLKEK